MAKNSYKIPDTLDKSFGDIRINLKSKDGVGVKPLPLSLILMWVGSIIAWLLLILKTFIASASFGVLILFTLLWFILTWVLLRRNKLNICQASMVASAANYLPKSTRKISTRNASNATSFMVLTNIKSISEDTGFIEFLDGSCGYMYSVVGTASALLFDEDRVAIIDRCDTFFRKMRPDCEMIFITVKEPQKVFRQLSALESRYQNLEVRDPDLLAMADTAYQCLRDEVGGSYRSIHQYLILKARNPEELTVAKNTLQIECESSQLVFKQCTALLGEAMCDVFSTVYKGKESV